MEGELLVIGQAQPGVAADQLFQGQPGFPLAEVGAEAVVEPEPERQVLAGVGPLEVELVWPVEH